MTKPKKRKYIIYGGRMQGRRMLIHDWFMRSIPFLKEGYLMGVPVEEGIGVFEFKGVRKPKSEFKITEII